MQTPDLSALDKQEALKDKSPNLHEDIAYPILGKLAIENNLISKNQFKEAIDIMLEEKKSGKTVSLEEVLISHGYIQPFYMEKLLASTIRAMDRNFCSTAQQFNILDAETCEMALSEQAEAYKKGKLIPISSILIEKELLKEEEKERILENMRKANKIEPSQDKNDFLKSLNEEKLRQEITKSTKTIDSEEMAIATMALQYNFIDTKELQSAIKILSENKNKAKNLTKLMVELKMISSQQMALLHATRLFHKTRQLDKTFAYLCLLNNFCEKKDTEKALDIQLAKFKGNKTVKLLGNILMEMKLINHKQMISVLKEQKRISQNENQDETIDFNFSDMDVKDAGVFVEISEDGLNACLVASPAPSPKLKFKDLLQLIKNAGVLFGLLPEEELKRYLKDSSLQESVFQIAKGFPPQKAENGYIKYGFDPDYLKAGTIMEDGSIDYFTRGEVPFVTARTLLAERIPPKEGKPGMSVRGEEILPGQPKDVELRAGEGAELSLDAQMVHALIDGQAHTTLGAKVSVFPEMSIRGDVDLKTGHINFKGIVNIHGSVKPGFNINSAAVSAAAVFETEIIVNSEVKVQGGIIGSKIKAGGSVHAKFIVDSEILAFGDVIVEKEVINSTIRTSGALIISRGKIISSEAAARGGIEVHEIGTDMSAPCKLFIGLDFHAQNEAKRLKEKAHLLRKNMEVKHDFIEKEEKKQINIHTKISNETQKQEEKENLIKKLEALSRKKDDELLKKIKTYIKQVQNEISEIKQEIEVLFDEQDLCLNKILYEQNLIKGLSEKVEETLNEYKALREWNKDNPPKRILKARGSVSPGTIISGSHSQYISKEKLSNMVFTEIQSTDYEGKPNWLVSAQKA